MESAVILKTVIFALGAGIFCQILSERLKVPSIFFLLVFGALLGPDFLGLIRPASIQEALPLIIELGVAIVLFEGGLSLRLDQFRLASQPIRRLLTVGALITFIACSLASRWIVDLPWRYAFIFGALMIVTGPTVIGPILKRIRLKQQVATTLNWESILLDPIGAILAILIAEFILAEKGSLFLSLIQFLKILLSGGIVGLVSGRFLLFLLRRSESLSEENVNLMILAGALLSFEAAELLTANAGLLSVVLSGMVLANADHPHKEVIVEFKATLASLWVGFLFILLAARLHVRDVFGFGWEGLWLLGAVMLLIRPLNIFVSTRKTTLALKEKIFLSWMAPRGIIAASAASLFALIFAEKGETGAADLESLTYLVIASTVVLQGLFAGPVSRILGVYEARRDGFLVIGAHPLARAVAKWLKERSLEVKLIDTDFGDIRKAAVEGFETYHGSALDASFLQELPLQRVGTVLALTSNNEVNVLACQIGGKLIGPRSGYQILPRRSRDAEQIPKEIGGTAILPKLPFLDEVNGGLEERIFEWREETAPKGTTYDGPITIADGLFWPLFPVKPGPVAPIPSGHSFKSDEKCAGLFKKEALQVKTT
jgi:NhaP-type Na+/H+ or K+/H+ antiporter